MKRNYPAAWVILPDHFHMIINSKNRNISDIIHRFKRAYSWDYKHTGRIWQNRFWDHLLRNELDFNNHLDYIHFNPVKHNIVNSPIEYEHSSFHKFVENGYYMEDWGKGINFDDGDVFGE